jgi:hypothetical protein
LVEELGGGVEPVADRRCSRLSTVRSGWRRPPFRRPAAPAQRARSRRPQ